MKLKNANVLITGGASGIGKIMGRIALEKGAKSLIIWDVNQEAMETTAAEFASRGRVYINKVDITNSEVVAATYQQIKETCGNVDILINCAGGNSARVRGYGANWHEASYEDIEWGLDVNLKGAMFFCRAVLPGMIARQQGVIVNLASVNAYVGTTFGCDYSAAKHGLIGLTKSIALCGAPHHVRCVGVAPGPVLTREAMSKMTTPLGRAAEVSEVVDLIDYLVSDKAAFVTGSTHVIDGGFTCR